MEKSPLSSEAKDGAAEAPDEVPTGDVACTRLGSPALRHHGVAARSYTFTGAPQLFSAAGFHDVTPPGQTRRVMRYEAK